MQQAFWDVVKAHVLPYAIEYYELNHQVKTSLSELAEFIESKSQHAKPKVIRSVKEAKAKLTEEQQCEQIVKHGGRCNAKKVAGGQFCSRHKKKVATAPTNPPPEIKAPMAVAEWNGFTYDVETGIVFKESAGAALGFLDVTQNVSELTIKDVQPLDKPKLDKLLEWNVDYKPELLNY